MEHVVFFSETPGEPEFRRVGDLEEAVRLVEKLRNDRGISDVSLHALTEVPVSFRTYYRVEVAVADGAARNESPAAGSEDAPELVADSVADKAPSIALSPVPELEPVQARTDSFASFAVLPEPALDSVLTLLPPPGDDEFGSGSDTDESGVSFLHLADEAGSSDEEPTADSEAAPGDSELETVDSEAEAGVAELETVDSEADADQAVSFELPQARAESEPQRSLGYFAH
jgi:hypothetical protein